MANNKRKVITKSLMLEIRTLFPNPKVFIRISYNDLPVSLAPVNYDKHIMEQSKAMEI